MTRDAYLIDGVRTPRGRGRPTGGLHEVHPQQLLAQVLNALVSRTGVDPERIEDVVTGNGDQGGDHANDIGRLAVLAAGLPVGLPGVTLNRFCGSGQQAVMFAAMGVGSGWQQAVIAAGVESMSRYTAESMRRPSDAGNPALRERYPLVPQGISADLIATLEGFTRDDVDAFAVRSQQRAAAAMANGDAERSVIPVTGANGEVLLDRDEHPRAETTLASLGRLEPAFAKAGAKPRQPDGRSYDRVCCDLYPTIDEVDHVHHAGNSSGVVDGAGALLVASDEFARANDLTPRARVVAGGVAGVDPVIMLTAPGPASEACLVKAGMTAGDIDLWEINEAFAAVPLKVIRDLRLDEERVNVAGGAIALGHPIGATGTMLFQTLMDELERRNLQTGLVTMCTGAGMATATIIERV